MIGPAGFMQAPKADPPKSLFRLAKDGAIGQQVQCPQCGRSFRKKTKGHTFCSNGRTKRGPIASNCKDRFWNRMDPNKSREAFRERLGLEPYPDLDDDPSWDAHKS